MKKNTKYFLFILLHLIFLNCWGGIIYWKHFAHEYPDKTGTYIIFSVPSKFMFEDQKFDISKFDGRLYYEDKERLFSPLILINPVRNFDFFQQWYGGNQFLFFANCIYKISVPAGESSYEFEFDFGKETYGSLRKKILIPSDHSVILKFNPKVVEVPFIHPFDQASGNRNAEPIIKKWKIVEIDFDIYPSSQVKLDSECLNR
ncbi:hypothetical protein EHQ13_16115 [Leptospira gomenensis]|uniref:Uncharacterized protein n=1 Tax=Leptospira gomenensis TaxID=2484974 RepID=A0A5F1YIE3_9LEPT|nr:hypothetical protein [Leptospira gomenensis]TGK38437.1 hypothetical protein EHQ17_02000 [Leptospira gomenensis]TGK42552.1 hypothetical protein EHQ07_14095 [Leptospira gomenensis]TGK55800.1 hypothetical protein EHQ13_16115 [Leptospira gomenensis]